MDVRVRLRSLVSTAWRRCFAVARSIRTRCPSAEGWAAIAAIAAAITAGFSLMQQQQAAMDAIRPELIVSGWRVDFEKDPDNFSRLFIDAVQNVGAGPAFRVLIYAPQPARTRLTVLTDVSQIAVLAKDVKVRVDATIKLAFKGEPKSSPKLLALEVHLTYSDLRGNRYRTMYDVLVSDQPIGFTERLGPGVSLRSRRTVPDSRGRWWWPFNWP